MIERTTGYKVGDEFFTTIEDAQAREVLRLLKTVDGSGAVGGDALARMASDIVKGHKSQLIDILTTGPKSKPKARLINGAKRTRRSKNVVALDAGNQSTTIQ